MSQAADRIREFIEREPKSRLTALLHHITVDALRKAYGELKRWAAPGVDGMTWKEYAVGLEDRLVDLHDRVQRGSVPGDAIAAGEDTQGGWRDTTAWRGGAGGQDRPESRGGQPADADI